MLKHVRRRFFPVLECVSGERSSLSCWTTCVIWGDLVLFICSVEGRVLFLFLHFFSFMDCVSVNLLHTGFCVAMYIIG